MFTVAALTNYAYLLRIAVKRSGHLKCWPRSIWPNRAGICSQIQFRFFVLENSRP